MKNPRIISALGVTLLLLAGAVVQIQPAQGHYIPGTFVNVCGVVQNVVGWELDGVHVRAVVSDTSSFAVVDNHFSTVNHHSVVTEADGRFVITELRANVDHVLVLNDTRLPSDPSRGGALYLPERLSFKPLLSQVTPTGCFGAPGVLLPATATVLSAPGQGFVEASVKDAAAASRPGLPDVAVAFTATMDLRDAQRVPQDGSAPTPDAFATAPYSFRTRTDSAGLARFACPALKDDGPAVAVFSGLGYVDAVLGVLCEPGGLHATEVLLWRRPIDVVVGVTNETDVTDLSPVDLPPKAGVRAPMAGVALAVKQRPDGLAPLAAGSPSCQSEDHSDKRPFLTLLTTKSPYVCAATTNVTGHGTLRLPWGGEYAFEAKAPGYVTAGFSSVLDLAEAEPRKGGDARQDVSLVLKRPTASVTARVVNVSGVGLAGVDVELSNDTAQVTTETGTNGFFAFSDLGVGPYRVKLTKEGHNERLCAADVTLTGLASFSRPDCLELIQTGKSVIRGRLNDALMGTPIPGLSVCVEDGTCTSTLADGIYRIEVAPNTAHNVSVMARQAWVSGLMPASSGGVDGFTVVLPTDLERALAPLAVLVRNETQGLPGARVNVSKGIDGDIVLQDAFTNATGHASGSLPWTVHPLLNGFNASYSYVVNVTRHTTDVHHRQESPAPHASAVFSLAAPPAFVDDPPVHVQTVLMTEEGTRSTAVVVQDAHVNTPLVATITAEPIPAGSLGYSCGTVSRCSATANNTGEANLDLYAGHTYKICARANGYETLCQNAVPGASLSFRPTRNVTDIDVTVVDAHTGVRVKGIALRVNVSGPNGSAFSCNGGSTTRFTCAGTSDGGFTRLKLPWTKPSETLCIEFSANALGVVMNYPSANDVNAHEETGVVYQAAQRCQPIPDTRTALPLPLFALRAPTLVVTGKVEAPTSPTTPVAGATVQATTSPERGRFVCAPTAHNATPFAETNFTCGPVAASSGAFTLKLPMGTARNHTWIVNATAPGRFTESYTQVGAGALPYAFTLWPKTYRATITLREESTVGQPHGCVAEPGTFLLGKELRHDDFDPDQPLKGPFGYVTQKSDLLCEAEVEIVDWARLPQPMPAAAGPWMKNDSLFVFQLLGSAEHNGFHVAKLGPRATTTDMPIFHKPSQDDPVVPHLLRGVVEDADARNDVGLAGARVTATRTEGPCHGRDAASAFSGASDLRGEYVIPLGCGGTYAVTVEHSDLYGAPAPQTVTVGVSPRHVVNEGLTDWTTTWKNFTLARARGGFSLQVNELAPDLPAVANVRVDPVGVDALADPAFRMTDAQGAATFVNLPWGAYQLALSYPSSPDHEGVPTMGVVVLPGATPTAYRAFTVRT